MKNTYTGRQYPRNCPLCRHAEAIHLMCQQERLVVIKQEIARLQAIEYKPIPEPMSTTDLLKEGFRKYFGVQVIELKADEVTKC